jgi:hypothetical protein
MPMNVRTIAPLSLFMVALGACRASPIAREPGLLPLAPVFGPIIANEVIGGRADDGEGVWLLLGGAGLVRVDLEARRVRRAAIRLGAGEHCWGLARLQDGSLWTLKGRHAVIQIDPEGAIIREAALAEPHLGLFGAADRLIYQQASFTPPGPALRAGAPGDTNTVPWSEMTTRAFGTIARASAIALNLVACGGSAQAERPCWFPDEAAVSLIDARGVTRKVALPGLDLVPPEILLTAENPPRPVRDAYVDREGRIWVLSSGTPPAGRSDRPGGWILARYATDGAADGLARLQESARLILRADAGRVLLLSGTGYVVEVKPW